MCVKAITVRFHLTHPAEKQAWEKLLTLRNERHLSFSQIVADAINAYQTSGADSNQLVQNIADSVEQRLQQMLPAYLAGYSAGASAPAVPPVTTAPSQVTSSPHKQESDDAMPDFGDSCMDFDFIGG